MGRQVHVSVAWRREVDIGGHVQQVMTAFQVSAQLGGAAVNQAVLDRLEGKHGDRLAWVELRAGDERLNTLAVIVTECLLD